MSRLQKFKSEFVSDFPSDKNFEQGKLYINERLMQMSFYCPCGCKEKKSTAFQKDNDYKEDGAPYSLRYHRYAVTLTPSLQHSCGANYNIIQNKVVWS